jgi:hypothetical protein
MTGQKEEKTMLKLEHVKIIITLKKRLSLIDICGR